MTTWVSATVLKVLAEQQLQHAGAEFTSEQLVVWLGDQLTRSQRIKATTRLSYLKFITHRVTLQMPQMKPMRTYTVTTDGAAAIAEAGRGAVLRSGCKGTRKANTLQPDSLVMRLWALIRLRTIVDSESATQTLCDAGSDDFRRMQVNVQRHLRRWAEAGALTEAARRINPGRGSNGNKRYVLVDAWKSSTHPPAWRQIALQRAAAEEQS